MINESENNFVIRPPVVTFMGHIDHGKTSIQDFIRKTNIANKESGKITQKIGASTIKYKNKFIVFIDTPGHEAFSMMRLRGTKITDIVVLVIAADDGIKPQTIEALNHAKAANVPIIVAINKIDLQSADSDNVIFQMQENGLLSEDLGGNVGTIKLSALTGYGIDKLLDRIILESEMLELKADNNLANGIVIESNNNSNFGAISNIIVKNGRLKLNDLIICDQYHGKVKLLINEFNEHLDFVDSGFPALLVGLNGTPIPGSEFSVVDNEKDIIKITKKRQSEIKYSNLQDNKMEIAKDLLFNKEIDRNITNLNFIIKTDVNGILEIVVNFLNQLKSKLNVNIDLIHSSVGNISENDVLLAAVSKAIIIGFNVKVNTKINKIAKNNNVEIKIYSIIYKLMEDIENIVDNKSLPENIEKLIGSATLLKIFNFSKNKKIFGCLMDDGFVKTGSHAKIHIKDEHHIAKVKTLKRFQNDVNLIKSGNEFGVSFEDNISDDLKTGCKISFYEILLSNAK